MFKCDLSWISWPRSESRRLSAQRLQNDWVRGEKCDFQSHRTHPWRTRTWHFSDTFTIVCFFVRWITAAHVRLPSIGLFVFSAYLVCSLLFHPLAYPDQTFKSAATLYLFQRLDFLYYFFFFFLHTLSKSPLPSFSCICGSKISNFIFFFVSSLYYVEVFYWCGEKQWGQGRALWWQKCIFNPCEWMAPHIPQQQALCWMAALTRLFSLLITALCLFTTDIVIYLQRLRGRGFKTIMILSLL